MVFKLSQATTGLISGFATVTVFEDPPFGAGAGKPKMVQAQFPFMIPAAEADDLKEMVTEAKGLLQGAVNCLKRLLLVRGLKSISILFSPFAAYCRSHGELRPPIVFDAAEGLKIVFW